MGTPCNKLGMATIYSSHLCLSTVWSLEQSQRDRGKGEPDGLARQSTQLGYFLAVWPWERVHRCSLWFLPELTPNNPQSRAAVGCTGCKTPFRETFLQTQDFRGKTVMSMFSHLRLPPVPSSLVLDVTRSCALPILPSLTTADLSLQRGRAWLFAEGLAFHPKVIKAGRDFQL